MTISQRLKSWFHWLPTRIQWLILYLAHKFGRLGPFYTAYYRLGCPNQVLSGELKGACLRFPDSVRGSFTMFPSMLLGTYEKELQPVWRFIRSVRIEQVVDVGASEGYYLSALGRFLPQAKLIGYESDSVARNLIKKNLKSARLWKRCELQGIATCENLVSRIHPLSFMLMDIEGGESMLLDMPVNQIFRECILLLEVHETLKPGLLDALRKHFNNGFYQKVFPVAPRELQDFPETVNRVLNSRHKLEIMNERRVEMTPWLLLIHHEHPDFPQLEAVCE